MSVLRDKSYDFALNVVKIIYDFQKREKEFILSRQLLRRETSVGANIEEAQHAESKADFIHKLSIASKEVNGTRYWLSLLKDSDIYSLPNRDQLLPEIEEIIKMLVTSIKTAKA